MSQIPVTEPTLLIQIRDPDDALAWERFVKLYTPLVFGFCRQRGLQDADASDLSQEVMKTVAQSIHRFDYDQRRGTFRSWLLRVTRNKLLKFFSKLQRLPKATGRTSIQERLEATPSPEETGEWNAAYQRRLFNWAAQEVENEFAPTTWQAFWKTAVENQRSPAVAEELQISLGAVYIAKSRVLARIRKQIATVAGDDDLDLATACDTSPPKGSTA